MSKEIQDEAYDEDSNYFQTLVDWGFCSGSICHKCGAGGELVLTEVEPEEVMLCFDCWRNWQSELVMRGEREQVPGQGSNQ